MNGIALSNSFFSHKSKCAHYFMYELYWDLTDHKCGKNGVNRKYNIVSIAVLEPVFELSGWRGGHLFAQ